MKVSIKKLFQQHGGQLHMSDAVKSGITRYMLYSLRDKGIITPISRGIYRLTDLPSINNPDLVTVCLRFRKAVICLVSALAYHEMTTQIPHRVSVAVPKKSRPLSLDYPPVKSYKFSDRAYQAGIEMHQIDGAAVRIYCIDKTLVDCFKFRNKIGMDIFLEAIKIYKMRKKFHLQKLIEYAKICRVEKLMQPWLQSFL